MGVTGSSQIGVTHNNIGKYCAIGDSDGTITLLELCSSLWEHQPKEKDVIQEIFDREKKKEDMLKKQRIANEAKKNLQAKEKEAQEKAAKKDTTEQKQTQITKIEENFNRIIEETKIQMKDVLDGSGDTSERPKAKDESPEQGGDDQGNQDGDDGQNQDDGGEEEEGKGEEEQGGMEESQPQEDENKGGLGGFMQSLKEDV